jgi:hypothetical protein
LGFKDVSNDAATKGQTSRTTNASQETEDDERGEGWGKSTADLEQAEHEISAIKNLKVSL